MTREKGNKWLKNEELITIASGLRICISKIMRCLMSQHCNKTLRIMQVSIWHFNNKKTGARAKTLAPASYFVLRD